VNLEDCQERAESSAETARQYGPPKTASCIDWFSEGEAKVVEVVGIKITIRFIGRKGRRARIAIVAPAGAEFRTVDAAKADGQAINS
jgi:hypothetical protein